MPDFIESVVDRSYMGSFQVRFIRNEQTKDNWSIFGVDSEYL